MQSFECTVVTPEASVFDDQVVYANLPAHDGQLGVMHGRAPMVVELAEGDLELKLPSGQSKEFRLAGGFAQMVGNKLTLLSESAEAPAAG